MPSNAPMLNRTGRKSRQIASRAIALPATYPSLTVEALLTGLLRIVLAALGCSWQKRTPRIAGIYCAELLHTETRLGHCDLVAFRHRRRCLLNKLNQPHKSPVFRKRSQGIPGAWSWAAYRGATPSPR